MEMEMCVSWGTPLSLSLSLSLSELGNSNNHINKVTACKTRLVSN